MNGLAYVGPVKVDWHSQPVFSPSSDPDPAGRDVKVVGEFEWPTANQLSELAANPDAAITAGGQKGVLVPIWMNNAQELAEYIGWYLLQSFNLSADVGQSAIGLPVGTISAVYLGQQPTLAVSRQSVPVGNDYGIAPQSVVVSPFRPADDAGDRFLVDPGGSFITRAYDPGGYDPENPVPAETAAIGLYYGTLTNTADELEEVCFPRLAWSKDAPKWLTQQGGDVWAYDRRAQRDVLGPHPFLESTDIRVDNGLVGFWVGNRGLRPFLNCQVFDGTEWREPGVVQFGTASDELVGASLIATTAEYTTIALAVQGRGDVLVSLYRGERELRVHQPAGMGLPTFSGVPPTTRLFAAEVDTARFGNGLVAASDDPPDIRLRWPADVSPSAWSNVWRLITAAALADLDTVGLRTIYSEGGIAEIECYIDDADQRAKVRVRDVEVMQTAPLDFDAGDDLTVGLSYDGTTLTLLWRTDAGDVSHISAAVTIEAEAFYDDTYFVNFSRWGDGDWGDGVWGGITHYAEGIVDNDMVFEDALSHDEFELLGDAATALDGIRAIGEGRLRRHVPFDAEPIVSLPAPTSGLSVDDVTEWDLTKATGRLNTEDVVALFATAASGDTAADQFAQAAAQNDQRVRVRG